MQKYKTMSDREFLDAYVKIGLILGPLFMGYFYYFSAFNCFYAPLVFTLTMVLSLFTKNKWDEITRSVCALIMIIAPTLCCVFSGGIYSPILIWLLPGVIISFYLEGVIFGSASSLLAIIMYAFLAWNHKLFDTYNEFSDESNKLYLTSLSFACAVVFTALFAKLARGNADKVAELFQTDMEHNERVLKANQEIIRENEAKINKLKGMK